MSDVCSQATTISSGALPAQAPGPRSRMPKKKTPQKPAAAGAKEGVPRGANPAVATCPKDCNSSSSNMARQSTATGSDNVVTTGLRVRNQNIPQPLPCSNANIKHLKSSQKRPAIFTAEKNSRSKCLKLSTPCKSTPSCQWTSPRNKHLTESSSLCYTSTTKKAQPDTVQLQVSPSSSTLASKQTKDSSTASVTSNVTPSISTSVPFKKPTPPHAPVAYVQGCPSSRTELHNSKISPSTTPSTSRGQYTAQSAIMFSNHTGLRNSAGSSLPNPNSGLHSSKTPVAQTFRTPSPQQLNILADKSAYLARNSFQTPPLIQGQAGSYSGTTLFQTPQDPPRTSASTMKATPPLCRCGRRAKRRMAQTPGPNMGRWFFSCVKGAPNSANSKTSGCGFFKWERPSTATSAERATPVGRQVYISKGACIASRFTPVLQAPGSLTGHRRLGLSSSCARSLR